MSLSETEVAAALERMLGKLKTLPACSSKEDVVQALREAAASAHPDWTVPSLAHEMTKSYDDGSVRVVLNAHLLLINPSGAYRIIDVRKEKIFHECPSASGDPFKIPEGFRI